MGFHPDSLPDLTGKVYIVTGGNAGIGYFTVFRLAEHGARVYMCARSPKKGSEAIDNIKKLHPNANVSLLQMDLMDLASVAAAAKRFLSHESALHGLVNNAGIMATLFEMTKDHHEAQWQTNYLSHWALTEHLTPLMQRTARGLPPGSVRIVNLTSSGHLGAPKDGIHFDDTDLKDDTPWTRYGQSKLANILHAKTLHRRYGPGGSKSGGDNGEIWTASIHPGVVETNISNAVEWGPSGWAPKMTLAVMWTLGLIYPADKGSWTSVFCAASPDMKAKQSGGYLEIFHRLAEPWWQSAFAKDEELAEKLEEWTKETMTREGWVP